MKTFQVYDQLWILSQCGNFVRLYSIDNGDEIVDCGWHNLSMFNGYFREMSTMAK